LEYDYVPLGESGVRVLDCHHLTPKPADSGLPYIAIPDIHDGRINVASARIISSSDFATWTAKTKPRAGDVLVTRRGRVGDTAAVPHGLECALGQDLVLLRSDGITVDQGYLRWATRGPLWLREVELVRNVGVVFDSLNVRDVPRMRIPRPPVPVQRAIAAFLGALDGKIDLNRRMEGTLEEIARALFQSWFVDFDPVRGAAPEDIRRLFPNQLVDSKIGSVPDGWVVAPLGDQIEVTRGLSYTGAGLADEGMPLHNLNSIRQGGGYKDDGIKHYVGAYRDRDRVRPGDLIVANTDLTQNARVIGSPALVPRSFGDVGLYSHHIFRLRPLDGSLLTPRWLYLLLAGRRMHAQVVGYSNGTTVNMLPKDGLTRPLIAVPPRELVERFDAIVAPMFDQQEALTAESKTLAELRDALLPKLISGQLLIGTEGSQSLPRREE
jgi:type I restriction enzyme S subunit